MSWRIWRCMVCSCCKQLPLGRLSCASSTDTLGRSAPLFRGHEERVELREGT